MTHATARTVILGAVAVSLWSSTALLGQAPDPLLARVRQEQAPLLDTLRDLVAIESGSRDIDGLNRISELIATRLRALGGDVQFIAPNATVRFDDTPDQIGRIVQATFKGTGTKKILVLAHMDTVYLKGMGAAQPFRIEGDRAYGLGIADNKHGVALVLHTVAALQALGVREYGTLTVLINADEEISSPGSRALITRLGKEHDVVFSCEGGGLDGHVSLATSGSGDILMRVTGRASHAGQAPEQGRNAVYELAHQMLQTRDLGDPSIGLKLNWTVASGGGVRNVIPAAAQAMADVRVQRVSDWDVIERRVREKIKTTLIPDTKVDITLERRRPPLEPTPASRLLGERAKAISAERGRTLAIYTTGEGGGTDAALAALETKAPVIESLGLQGFGSHSNDAEYVLVSSIEPRLYLLARLIMDVASGKVSVSSQ
jgi:glutamate carboxypeptidase